MRVGSTRTTSGAGAGGNAKRVSGAGGAFASALSETIGAASQPSTGTGHVGGVAGVLALQEVRDVQGAAAGPSRRRAVQRAERMLDELEQLRLELVAGVISRERLEQLAALVRPSDDPVDDPQLAAILSEIELRAAVELAKRQTCR